MSRLFCCLRAAEWLFAGGWAGNSFQYPEYFARFRSLTSNVQVQKSMAYWGLLLCVAFSSAGVLVMIGSMRADVCDSEIVRVGKRRVAV